MIATSISTGRASWLHRISKELIVAAVLGLAMHGAHGRNPAVVVAQAGKPDSDATMNTAMEQYRQGRYSIAYVQFCKLADEGNAEAARIALIMLRYGRRMYGTEWGSSQPQIDLWIRLAGQPGEPMTSETGD
jgi:hypothetical protein